MGTFDVHVVFKVISGSFGTLAFFSETTLFKMLLRLQLIFGFSNTSYVIENFKPLLLPLLLSGCSDMLWN